ncbi:hypothetical protein [Acidiphilium acidophilum]|uniref:hypothetical protein n=1 Tax=Acidiphilium acidophilum TaxID=76588 RepID=UPI002E8E6F79|nr:hypothetical protein [Acidiphilium acidophilum]
MSAVAKRLAPGDAIPASGVPLTEIITPVVEFGGSAGASTVSTAIATDPSGLNVFGSICTA